MHGLVFVTWEKYLLERFQEATLERYRKAINETPSTAPLVSRTYDDKLLLAGVEAAHRVTGIPTEQLLYEYGRYFIVNHSRLFTESFLHLNSTAILHTACGVQLWLPRPMHQGPLTEAPSRSSLAESRAFSSSRCAHQSDLHASNTDTLPSDR